ncbi:Wzz/FepE/Etk N-terminal domain-containing protein [Methylomonas sp. AM2-LC]|uniref:Wzz/FepE/Etk N-terminal domain-containing protein n=1 Tax=Methylomonas sp. AM2-LC TaxID=3153301 RepID=UPI00326750FC
MENQTPDIKDYLKIIKRRRRFVIIPFFVIFLISIVVAVVLPSIYRSSATILIEEQEIPSELVRSTVTTFADQRIQQISQRIMSRSNLMDIIKKFNLYADLLKNKTEERVLEKMRKSIRVDTVSADVIDPRNGQPTKATIAFILAFDNTSAEVAQQVDNELVSLFLKENIKSRTESADNAALFLNEESKRLKDKIIEIQASLAGFKEKNLNQLPEANQLNQQELTSLNNQLLSLDTQDRSAQERRFYIIGELAQIDPNTTSVNAAGNRVYDMKDRLKELQSQYPSMVSRYSDTHPDVLKAKREIDSLKNEIGSNTDLSAMAAELTDKKSQLGLLLKQYSEKHPDVIKLQKEISSLQQSMVEAKQHEYSNVVVQPDNPAYISLKAQLDSVDSDIKSLAQTRAQFKHRIDELRDNLRKSPLIEKEYMDMIQELDNTNVRYREVSTREMEAQIAQQLELQKKGERFTLIEPPQLPSEAQSPKRNVIVFLGFVLAILGGFAVLGLAEMMDSSIHSEKAITHIIGTAPLATIPYFESHKEHLDRLKQRKALFFTCLLIILAVAIAFHFIIMPLDVFWLKLLRIASNL